ncbi:Twin-arginine translocation pathway signal [Rubrobacter xylanophilus DSM 9941]|uniref:Cytochrome bc1 complex Rieske iron-sulfur subunit n=1 Tax=Rubrobacter xylanophilus (strain DSM 9941 / JCM 11954 / NBRC 16129 / PRD-1) TaxID=266117 RepID=Q1AXM6_RUBXD|nr:Rieske (2Fe-2S) protein [Rubrobacter xylanophilus]ABG03852.1 Twin-arginine translocation pathway signal [Rubrobacter xylanophilus DSM 9941]
MNDKKLTNGARRTSRREFLGLGAAAFGLASAGAPLLISACGEDLPEVGKGQEIAREAEIEPGSAYAFADAATGKPALLVRLENGDLVAYSAECTHQGCTVSYRDKGYLACPCHGSVFSASEGGEVVSGPAEEPLQRLRIEVRDGRVFRA